MVFAKRPLQHSACNQALEDAVDVGERVRIIGGGERLSAQWTELGTERDEIKVQIGFRLFDVPAHQEPAHFIVDHDSDWPSEHHSVKWHRLPPLYNS